GLKIAVFPIHAWQPDAYQRAPDAVTTIVAALVSTASAYALLRVSYTVFTVEFLAASDAITTTMLVVSGASILAGSVLAAMQSDLKRMFAYSSVAQFGMIVAAIALANETALLGAAVHLVGHGLIKFGLFLGVGLLAYGYGARRLEDLASVAREAPFTAGSIAVLALALVGIPPSVGFLGKWYIGVGAVETSLADGGAAGIGIAAVIFVSTLFTLSYVARLLERFYFAGVGLPGDHGEPAVADGGTSGDDTAARDETHERSSPRRVSPVEDAPTVPGVPDRVPPASLAALVAAALVAIALGFAGFGLAEWFDPFLTEVFA
ncbi:monovalent cation/H+ antiporter subunit D family protein, partial [Halorubrum sp. SD626R]|uniref:proton-conducting transporter transmembrane domain-containing protein n=2 Tax=Halorubrum TaxID=56688 RepID=UPI00113A7FB3